MAQWIFLRHGESTANAGGFLAGWEDVPLTPEGERQARAAGLALAGAPIARVVTSDLRRATRTAELFLTAWRGEEERPLPPLRISAALRERHLGQWSGLYLEALRADGRHATLLGWDTRPPGGESHLDLARRVLAGLVPVGDEGPTLFVSHGGLLRTLFGLLDGTPEAEIGRVRIPNAVATTRELAPGTWASLLNKLDASSTQSYDGRVQNGAGSRHTTPTGGPQ